jgi:hypothetical protein
VIKEWNWKQLKVYKSGEKKKRIMTKFEK